MGYRNAPPHAWDLTERARLSCLTHEHSINLIAKSGVMMLDDTCGIFLLYREK